MIWCLCFMLFLDDPWKFSVRELPAETASGSVESGYYVVMYSATWCGPCQAWKRNELPKLQAAGVAVTVVDCDREPQWTRSRQATDTVTGKTVTIAGVKSYPTFAIVRRSDRFPVSTVVGPVPAATLKAKIPASPVVPAPAPEPPLSMKWNIQGDWSPSIEQTRQHLIADHGVDAAGMSHAQMLAVHDAIHDAGR